MEKIDWGKTILYLLPIALAIFGIFCGVSNSIEANKEQKLRIETQNELARQSKIHQEDTQTWSRLAQQKDDLIHDLTLQSATLADLIRSRDEHIVSLNKVVVNLSNRRIVVRNENLIETVEGDRIRVAFDQIEDPLRVHGFTLTNPAEAEINVDYTRPMNLTLSVVQRPDRSWRAYVQTDWPGVEIEDIQTSVSPLPDLIDEREWYENIILGAGLGTNTSFNSLQANAYVLYSFGSFAIGPEIGVSVSPEDSAFYAIGLNAQVHPF